MNELRLFGEPPAERADAARNRARAIAAAEALFAERGVEAVSMDDVAQRANVGKGTLYRRFGDKAGLGVAVLDAREHALQDAILRGRPPLGPGAPPHARLHAFVDAYLDYLERNLDLAVWCETAAAGVRYRSAVYAGWHRHVELLLRDAGWPETDASAHLVLAMLDADLHRSVGDGAHRLRAAIHALLDAKRS